MNKLRKDVDLYIACQQREKTIVVAKSLMKCPQCGFEKEETMPVDFCQDFYECASCKTILQARAGDCCVFCSYGNVPCPPSQLMPVCSAPQGRKKRTWEAKKNGPGQHLRF